jgi:N6-L-threonylcarbamoyladenine synthase
MKCVLGIDTSNYTTSAALFNIEKFESAASFKKLVPVKDGELGIRQSDAVFHHTVQLPWVLEKIFSNGQHNIVAVSVSDRPCEEQGSYMPCFLAGVSAAEAAAKSAGVPIFKTTHQKGHIFACLYSAEQLKLIKENFICFHVSGGTTQALLVRPSEENIITAEAVSESLDLKAGQAIDRIGVKLGLKFPAGAELEKLALKSDRFFKKAGAFKENNFSLSGLQNLAEKMMSDGETPADTAKFTIDYIANTLEESVNILKSKYGDIPLCFAGGVMSNSIIRKRFENKFGAYFCAPEYSSDNAVGTAVYGSLKYGKISSKRNSAE